MLKFRSFAILSLLSLVASVNSFAAPGGAGWGASGGELLGDTLNPWWVKNTTNVNYCIDIDRNGISATPEKVQAILSQALAFWKNEFARKINYVENAVQYNQLFSRFGVGSQTFTLVTCNGSEDLKFQFGYETLSEKQKFKIKNIKQYVGIAVRTAYDEAQLKGKGFVFIASDIGKNSYKNDADLIDRPWSIDQILYIVLVHEIGHVFGVPHVGSEYSLMSQQGPGYFLTKQVASAFKNLGMDLLTSSTSNTFFFPPQTYNSCVFIGQIALTQTARDFFGLPANATCLGYDINENTKVMTVSYGVGPNSALTPAGVISNVTYKPSLEFAVMVNAIPTQTVLPIDTNLDHTEFLVGPFFLNLDATGGIFHAKDGTEKPTFFHLSQNSPKFYGVVNGTIESIY